MIRVDASRLLRQMALVGLTLPIWLPASAESAKPPGARPAKSDQSACVAPVAAMEFEQDYIDTGRAGGARLGTCTRFTLGRLSTGGRASRLGRASNVAPPGGRDRNCR